MNSGYPVFVNGTKIIPQSNCCFVYSWKRKIFDIFNFESLIFFNEMHGTASTQQIVHNVTTNYTETSPKTIESDLLKLQEFMEERGYLTISTTPSSNPKIFEHAERVNEIKIVQADIELTKNCNLRCKYCFNEAGKGSPDLPLYQWIELLDSLYNAGLRVIKVSGGEPFLYTNILDFLDYAQKKFIVSVNTNGYFINEEISRRLSTMHLQSVQVSLDSITPKVHDSLRGKGTWEKAMRAIKLLHHAGVPIRVSTTVTTQNYNELGNIRNLANKYEAELSLEVLKKVGKANNLDSMYFISNPEKVKQYSDKVAINRILDELDMTCQAQLGVVGISYRGNIKPCNLTEEFFSDRNAGVVVKFEENWRYSDSPTLINTNTASNKVTDLLKSHVIKSKDKCIFEY